MNIVAEPTVLNTSMGHSPQDHADFEMQQLPLIMILDDVVSELGLLKAALENISPDFRIKASSLSDMANDDTRPDVVLLCSEVIEESGMLTESVHAVRAAFPNVPVVVLTDQQTDSIQPQDAVEIGLSGCVAHSAGLDGLAKVLWLVVHGGMCFPRGQLRAEESPQIEKPAVETHQPCAMTPQTTGNDDNNPVDELLTQREKEVIEHLSMGKQNKIIAYELGISISTVKVHVRNIMRKTGATNRVEAALSLLNEKLLA